MFVYSGTESFKALLWSADLSVIRTTNRTRSSELAGWELRDIVVLPIDLNAYSTHPVVHLSRSRKLWKSFNPKGLDPVLSVPLYIKHTLRWSSWRKISVLWDHTQQLHCLFREEGYERHVVQKVMSQDLETCLAALSWCDAVPRGILQCFQDLLPCGNHMT
jgi:hypothetical protein